MTSEDRPEDVKFVSVIIIYIAIGRNVVFFFRQSNHENYLHARNDKQSARVFTADWVIR